MVNSNNNSSVPVHQARRERSQQERNVHARRIHTAYRHSRGQQPLSPICGPSSNDSYTRRATGRPPPYADSGISSAGKPAGQSSDTLLPTYDTAMGRQQKDQAEDGEPVPLSVKEEKERLHQVEEENRRTSDDEVIAQTLSRDDAKGARGRFGKSDEQLGRHKGKARKIGRWFADAARGIPPNRNSGQA